MIFPTMQPIVLDAKGRPIAVRTGALPSPPDLRDYNDRHPKVYPLVRDLGIGKITSEELPTKLDKSAGFSEVEDQGPLGSCTAQAGVGLLEYMQRAAFGEHVDLARMFLYNATKWLLGWEGDTGAHLRITAAAMSVFGCPPESYYPYDPELLDVAPSAYEMALADKFKGLTYFRHEAGISTPRECAIASMKKYLFGDIPSMFAFYGFDSFSKGGRPGDVPMPGPNESVKWAHAVDFAGYDDEYEIENTLTGAKTRGAAKFRNSWGRDWGQDGYGWIPYEFFLRGYCWDDWSVLSVSWLDTGQFGWNA